MGAQNLGGRGKAMGHPPNPFLGCELSSRRGSEIHFPWDLKCGGGLLGVGVHLPQFWRLGKVLA